MRACRSTAGQTAARKCAWSALVGAGSCCPRRRAVVEVVMRRVLSGLRRRGRGVYKTPPARSSCPRSSAVHLEPLAEDVSLWAKGPFPLSRVVAVSAALPALAVGFERLGKGRAVDLAKNAPGSVVAAEGVGLEPLCCLLLGFAPAESEGEKFVVRKQAEPRRHCFLRHHRRLAGAGAVLVQHLRGPRDGGVVPNRQHPSLGDAVLENLEGSGVLGRVSGNSR